MEDRDSHMAILKNSKNPLRKKLKALKATVSALHAFQKRAQYPEAVYVSLKEIKHELVQKNLSGLHDTSSRMLDRFFATSLTRLFALLLKAGQHLASWFTKETSQLCTDSYVSIRNCHYGIKKSQKHAIQTQSHAPGVPQPPHRPTSRRELYNLFFLSRTVLLTAIITAKLFLEQCASIFLQKLQNKRPSPLSLQQSNACQNRLTFSLGPFKHPSVKG